MATFFRPGGRTLAGGAMTPEPMSCAKAPTAMAASNGGKSERKARIFKRRQLRLAAIGVFRKRAKAFAHPLREAFPPPIFNWYPRLLTDFSLFVAAVSPAVAQRLCPMPRLPPAPDSQARAEPFPPAAWLAARAARSTPWRVQSGCAPLRHSDPPSRSCSAFLLRGSENR